MMLWFVLPCLYLFGVSVFSVRTNSKLPAYVACAGAVLVVTMAWTLVTSVGARNAAMNDGDVAVQRSFTEAVATAFNPDVMLTAVGGGDSNWVFPGVFDDQQAVPVEDREFVLPEVQPEHLGFNFPAVRSWVYGIIDGDPGLTYVHAQEVSAERLAERADMWAGAAGDVAAEMRSTRAGG